MILAANAGQRMNGETDSRSLREGAHGLSAACASYREWALAEHGSIVNPITGEEVDIMQQCVNLQLDTEDSHEVGDQSAYREALVDFAQELTQGTPAWVALKSGVYERGLVNRVNAEDESN